MTFITDAHGVVSSNNTDSNVSGKAWASHTGTAQGGSATTVTLAADASSDNDFYNNLLIEIIDGKAINLVGIITDYVGSTKVATVTLDTIPDSTSVYVIHIYSGQCQAQNISNSQYNIKLSSTDSSNDDFYNNAFIKFYNDFNENEFHEIIDYDGSTKVATIKDKLKQFITSNTYYAIFGEGGIASSATSTTLVLEESHGHATIDDNYNNFIIKIVSGTGAGQSKTITNFVGDTGTCTVSEWDIIPDSTSNYLIFGGWSGVFETVLKYSQITVALDIGLKENCFINNEMSLTNDGTKKKDKVILHTNKFSSNVHLINVSSEYYRLSLISLGTTIVGHVQSIFHTTKSGHHYSSLNEEINSQQDCNITRAVITGSTSNNRFSNVGITSENSLKIAIAEPLTGFGEVMVSQSYPVSQILFTYDTSDVVVDTDPGTQIYVSTEGSVGVAHVQGIYLMNGSHFTSSGAGNYFTFYGGDGNAYYVWFDVNSGNSDPSPGGTGMQVDITDSDSSSTVASSTATAISLQDEFSASAILGNIVQITNNTTGAVTQTIRHGTMPNTTTSAISHDSANSTLNISHGDGIGVYTSVRGKRAAKYRAGQSLMSRFTAIFNTAVTGTNQLAGIGNQVSGFFFGYNGTQFGIMHRSSGQPEIRRLTITAGSTSSGSVIIMLDGIEFIIPIDNASGNAQESAYDIGAYNGFAHGNWYLDFGTDDNDDAYIDFLSTTATAARSLTYSFDANGVSGITVNFSQINAGVAVVNTWISQYDWNVNRFLGEGGTTDIVLDPTKGNVYQIKLQWLGFGNISFYIMNNETGLFEMVHRIKYTNSSTTPSIVMPYLRTLYATYTTSVTTSLTLKAVSSALFTEGIYRRFDSIFSHSASLTTTSGSEEHIITYRNLRIFRSKGNNTECILETLNITNDGNKSATVKIYRDVTLVKTKHNSIYHDNSSLSYTENTTTTDFSTGSVISTLQVGGNETVTYDFRKLDIILHLNETLTVTATRNTTTNAEINLSFTWNEDR